jgi:hypothetical protein
MSLKLWNMTGDSYVKSMSDEAIGYFVDGAVFYEANGNFTLYNSARWEPPTFPIADPSSASLCAIEKGKCECTF